MPATIVPDYRALAERLAGERAGRVIALTNGCFDVLHVGHVRLLAEARGLADVLIVALNGDLSVRANKGQGRPWVPLAERMEVVAALDGVDYVTSFDEPTAHGLLAALRPELYVKGKDRRPETIPEYALLSSLGTRLVFAGDEKSHSSSALIERMRGSSERG